MKKLTIVTGLACVFAVVLSAGCATGPKGPTDEELVLQQAQAFAADLVAGNVDKLLGYVSENFTHERVESKEVLANYIEMGKASGRIDDLPEKMKEEEAEVVFDDAEVTITDGTASVYPIEASSMRGSVTAELLFQKDSDGVWRISGLEVEGI